LFWRTTGKSAAFEVSIVLTSPTTIITPLIIPIQQLKFISFSPKQLALRFYEEQSKYSIFIFKIKKGKKI